jgi:TolB-like protein
MAFPLPDKPSIAVLPFDNMSKDPDQEYFSDGITEDIITDLSRVSGLFVIARHSTFKFKGKPVDVRDVARDLGVRYVLEGSVRKAGNKVRVTAQLIDAGTGNHLWAERYDRDLKDIFSLQDEIAGKIVAALEVKLAAGEQEQVAHRYTDNLEAYDLFLRGREYQLRGTKGYAQARRMFEKAIELDPKFAAAYAELSYTHWEFQKRKGLERSFKAAQRAVALDDTLPLARSRLAWAYLRKRQREDAIREAKRAIALDPNFAEGYAVLAEILNAADRPDEGIRFIRKAMRLNPFPPAKYLFVLGQSYYMMGHNQKAIATLERARNRNPENKPPHMHLIILYGETGQMEKARAETEDILRLLPNESIELEEQICTYAPGPLKRFLEGLRKAGFPEKSKSAAL